MGNLEGARDVEGEGADEKETENEEKVKVRREVVEVFEKE